MLHSISCSLHKLKIKTRNLYLSYLQTKNMHLIILFKAIIPSKLNYIMLIIFSFWTKLKIYLFEYLLTFIYLKIMILKINRIIIICSVNTGKLVILWVLLFCFPTSCYYTLKFFDTSLSFSYSNKLLTIIKKSRKI